jgi:hypothetical protein
MGLSPFISTMHLFLPDETTCRLARASTQGMFEMIPLLKRVFEAVASLYVIPSAAGQYAEG